MCRLFFVAIFLCLFPHGSTLAEEAASAVKIQAGAIFPLSGPFAEVGLSMQKGIELARSELQHVELSVVYEDDKSGSRTDMLTGARKLLDVDQVQILFSPYASGFPIVAPLVQKAKIPCLVLWDSNHHIASFGDFVAGFGYSNELAAAEMAEFTRKKLSAERAVAVAFSNEWSEVMLHAFVDSFAAQGGTVVAQHTLTPDTVDFRAIIQRARDSGVQAIYFPLWGAGLQSLVRQARQLRYQGALLSADSFWQSDIRTLGEAAEGVFVSQIWLEDPKFLAQIRARYGSDSSNEIQLGYAALGYDAVKLIEQVVLQIMKENLPFSPEEFARHLPGLAFQGVLGAIQLDQRRMSNRREKILKVAQGRFIEAEGRN